MQASAGFYLRPRADTQAPEGTAERGFRELETAGGGVRVLHSPTVSPRMDYTTRTPKSKGKQR